MAAVVTVSSASVLGLAAWLEPSAEGLGTHTAIGLPRCGWIAAADMPCPTCGMTTAFAHAADGNLIQAFITQPAGAIFAVVVAMIFLASLHTLATGQSVWPLIRPTMRPASWGVLGAVVLAGWVWKILTHRGHI